MTFQKIFVCYLLMIQLFKLFIMNMKKEFVLLQKWFNVNKLEKKMKYMIFGTRNCVESRNIKIEKVIINNVSEVGVVLNNKLIFGISILTK